MQRLEGASVWLGCGRLLDSLAPLVMSDLHFSVAATSSLSPDFSSKITTQTLVFFQKLKKKIYVA